MSDIERKKAQDWLRAVIAETGETPTSLARMARLSQSTLTRFLSKPDAPMIKLATLNAVAEAAGVPLYQTAEQPVSQAGGMAEEAIAYVSSPGHKRLDNAVSALIDGRPSIDPWILNTDALLLAGYCVGDVLIVNLNATPTPGSIVCVQVYEWEKRRAETRFRIFHPPYVVAATHDQAHWKPLLIDNDRVVIKGVVEAMVRI